MKKLLLIASMFFSFQFLLQSQEDTLQKSDIYRTWIKLETGAKLDGALYQTKDSSFLYATSHFKKDLLAGKCQIYEINYNKIAYILTRHTNHVGKGVLYGALGGLLTGAIIGYVSHNKDVWAPPVLYSAETEAAVTGTLGMLSGVVIGAIIGSIRIKIPINGNIDNFNKNKERFKKYSYRH